MEFNLAAFEAPSVQANLIKFSLIFFVKPSSKLWEGKCSIFLPYDVSLWTVSFLVDLVSYLKVKASQNVQFVKLPLDHQRIFRNEFLIYFALSLKGELKLIQIIFLMVNWWGAFSPTPQEFYVTRCLQGFSSGFFHD